MLKSGDLLRQSTPKIPVVITTEVIVHACMVKAPGVHASDISCK